MTLIMTFAGEGVGGIHRNPEQLEVIVYTMTWQSKIASTLSKIYAIIVSDTRAQTHLQGFAVPGSAAVDAAKG